MKTEEYKNLEIGALVNYGPIKNVQYRGIAPDHNEPHVRMQDKAGDIKDVYESLFVKHAERVPIETKETNQMTHTPTPWKVFDNGTHHNNKHITNWQIQFGASGECVVDHVYEEADAHLIAAAPDLLRELQRLVTYYQGETRTEAIVKLRDAEAVIKEANKGGTL